MERTHINTRRDDSGDPTSTPESSEGGFVVLTSGLHRITAAAGSTVAELRARHGVALDLDQRESLALMGGNPVAENTVLTAGSQLVFSPRAGEKG